MTGATRGSLLLDVRPLRESRPFRRLWAGEVLSGLGQAMGSFTVAWLVWDRTQSPTAIGLIGVTQLGPMLALTLLGGSWGDRYDRRALLVGLRVAQVSAAALLVLVVVATDSVVVLFPLIALQAALGSIATPVARATVATLLAGDRLAAGLAISHTAFQLSMLLGPLLGGTLVATQGPATALALETVALLAAVVGAYGLPRLGRPGRPVRTDPVETGVAAVVAGVRFVARTPVLTAVLLADLSATALAMPVALFPVLNAERFGGSPATLGLFVPALGLGGIAAGVFSGRFTGARRLGLVAVGASMVWGVALCLVGLAPSLVVSLGLLAVAGAADMVAVVCRGTIVQSMTPDDLRSRVSSLDFLVGAGGPKLGDLRAGLVADATSGSTSMVIGGAAAAAAAAMIALAAPALRRYAPTSDGVNR